MSRTELEALRLCSTSTPNNTVGLSATILKEAEENCHNQKLKYEQLKGDVRV